MKKIVIAVVLFFLCAPVYSSVTTADGLITLDYYEDTQSGIENRWILDFSVNDIGGGVESIGFDLLLYNQEVDFLNPYNQNTDYYIIGYYTESTMPLVLLPTIPSGLYSLPVPINTDFTFYTTNQFLGEPLINDFYIYLSYVNNLGVEKGEGFYLTGPVGATVPEPMGMLLFAFGAFLIKFLIK
ncbi:MAG: hypothetical protein AB1454_07670 [Candidatus Auribacterota bacterium]